MTMLHDITGSVPRNKLRTRKGRGKSAGKGKTAGRGTKGSGAHGGDVHWKPGHEGGQTPLFRRWPKRGFSNFDFERRFHVVNLADLNGFEAGTMVDANVLMEAGFIPDGKLPLKVLGDGKLTKKFTVVAGAFSKSALAKMAAAGCTAQNLKGLPYVPKKDKKMLDPAAKFARKKGGKRPVPVGAVEAEKPAEAPSVDAKPAE